MADEPADRPPRWASRVHRILTRDPPRTSPVHGPFHLFMLLAAFLIVAAASFSSRARIGPAVRIIRPTATPTPSATPTPDLPFGTYVAPTIAEKPEYTVFLVGDSMTAALGPHGGPFSEFMNARYQPLGKGILVDNYAAGGKNILDLMGMLNAKTTFWDATFEPLLSRNFDLILIESFGYNPLSQFPLEEGLKHQAEALDDVMKLLVRTHPQSAIAFVATIAPSTRFYARKQHPDSTAEETRLQAEERMSYIRNHIAFAQAHNIPLVNIFEKSLTGAGDGNLRYINPNDYIHPSFAGVDFIGREMADFIYAKNILPVTKP